MRQTLRRLPYKMRMAVAVWIALLAFALSAHAQEPAYMGYLEELSQINATSPEQSPRHEHGREILSDRVLDRKNRVIGEIHDVILNVDGSLSMLDVEFDRLKIGKDHILADYGLLQMEPAGNGYKTGFDKAQIEDMFPELLSSSKQARRIFGRPSIKSLAGASVKTGANKNLGRVIDILFDHLGGQALYLYVSMDYAGHRGKALAIPFEKVTYASRGKTIEVFVNDDLAAHARRDFTL